jgi:hypothetical protein
MLCTAYAIYLKYAIFAIYAIYWIYFIYAIYDVFWRTSAANSFACRSAMRALS